METEQHGIPYDRALFGAQADLVDRSIFALQAVTAAHDQSWGMGRGDGHFAVDLDEGTITFHNPKFKVTAPVQVVGTYNTEDDTWLWGWDHPSVPEHCAQAAQIVKAFAEQHGLEALLERKIACTESDAWAFTALAYHLADGQGAYRGPTGSALVFMTFGNITLSQPEPQA